jgi:hypothetical protein
MSLISAGSISLDRTFKIMSLPELALENAMCIITEILLQLSGIHGQFLSTRLRIELPFLHQVHVWQNTESLPGSNVADP